MAIRVLFSFIFIFSFFDYSKVQSVLSVSSFCVICCDIVDI